MFAKKLIKSSNFFSQSNKYRNFHVSIQRFAQEDSEAKKVAVLMSGCGYLDGTEVTEAVSCIIHLKKKGFNVSYFTLDKVQEEVYDHVSRNLEKNEIRNMISESTRITRTAVQKLDKLKVEEYEFLVIPGGFGVTKNLSNYDESPTNFSVDKNVETVIRGFHEAKKPIAMSCIAPVLVAKLFGTNNGGDGCTITLGDDEDYVSQVEGYGSTLQLKTVKDVVVDEKNYFVSTPAYMDESANQVEVFDAIGKMIEKTVKLTTKGEESSQDYSMILDAFKKVMPEKEYERLKSDLEGQNKKK
eukprot:gene6770-10934_t